MNFQTLLKSKLKRTFIYPLYKRMTANLFFSHLTKEICSESIKSLLDVGCGKKSPFYYIPCRKRLYSVGIDLFDPALKESKKKKIHSEYVKMNVLEIKEKFGKRSFDVVMALDLIEHLTKEEGIQLLDNMEAVASKKIIILTPNGFIEQDEFEENPLQVHKSGWTIDEFKKRGYKIYGMNGFKFIRGERFQIRLRPKAFWSYVSSLSQSIVYKIPSLAFHILAIKDIKRE